MGLVPAVAVFAYIGYMVLTNREMATGTAIVCGVTAYVLLMLWLLYTSAYGES